MKNEKWEGRKRIDILDLTDTCLISLQLLSLNPMNTVTIAQINANEADDEDDIAKNNFAMRIQYVCELALSNKLKVNNIDCVMSLDQVPDRSYDLVLMDLIEPSGKLSQDNFEKIPILRNKPRLTTSDSILLPMNLTVHCMLIQSDKLHKMSFVDDQNVHGFKLASVMNHFSVNHLQDLDLHSLLSSGKCEDVKSGKFLSEPLDVFKFDLMAPICDQKQQDNPVNRLKKTEKEKKQIKNIFDFFRVDVPKFWLLDAKIQVFRPKIRNLRKKSPLEPDSQV